MKAWSRRPVIVIAIVVLALTACSRERSGDVRDGRRAPTPSRSRCGMTRSPPAVLELEAGNDVTVEVRNDGSYGHNFTIESMDLSTGTVEPGQVVTATFVVPDGTTGYRCTFHPGMDGEIVT